MNYVVLSQVKVTSNLQFQVYTHHQCGRKTRTDNADSSVHK